MLTVSYPTWCKGWCLYGAYIYGRIFIYAIYIYMSRMVFIWCLYGVKPHIVADYLANMAYRESSHQIMDTNKVDIF